MSNENLNPTINTIDKGAFIERNNIDLEEIEDTIYTVIENYKKQNQSKNDSIDPTDFANYLGISVSKSNLSKCDRSLGVLTIKENNKPVLLVEKSTNPEVQKDIIAYESIRYLIEQDLGLANSPMLIHQYTEKDHWHCYDHKDKIGNICHQITRKMRYPIEQ